MSEFTNALMDFTGAHTTAGILEKELRTTIGQLSHVQANELAVSLAPDAVPSEAYFTMRIALRDQIMRQAQLLATAHEALDQIQRRAWQALQRERAEQNGGANHE